MLLTWKETKNLLKEYSIPLTRTEEIKTEKQAIKFSEKYGFPIVLKVFSTNLFHKNTKGLIVICYNKKQVSQAFKRMKSKGKLLAQRKETGIELACGMKRDAVFGPVIMFGNGGIFIEFLNNISLAIAPVNKKQAISAIKRIKGYSVLEEKIGEERIMDLAELLTKLSRISSKYPKIKAIDLNPVFANKKKISIVDPKFYVE